MDRHVCSSCLRPFKTQRSFSMHLVQNGQCQKNYALNQFESVCREETFTLQEETAIVHIEGNSNLYEQLLRHSETGFGQLLNDPGKYYASVELLELLRKAKAPIYLFDEIIGWTQKATFHYDIKFDHKFDLTREKIVDAIQNRFDLKGLAPKTETIYLPGAKLSTNLVYHDFTQCVYSILTDPELMKPENLLLGPNGELQYDPSDMYGCLNDVNTGSCFRSAHQKYVLDEHDLLCPIIFFSDKTHTDIHGRLCLEPVQFTLGIFNRETRSHPRAWRTLGYVNDLNKRYSGKGREKLQDYHLMLKVILKTFVEAQKNPIIWEMNINGKTKFVRLKIPVMFVIGDTEGHDKLCGRYSCRVNSQSLCRYCNIPFDATDDPFFQFRYTKVNTVKRLIQKRDVEKLQSMSMHCIQNAWHDIEFCDPDRGIHGATLAEVLHCIQQGMFEYAINALFLQKKKKKKPKTKTVVGHTINKKRKLDADSDIEEESITDESCLDECLTESEDEESCKENDSLVETENTLGTSSATKSDGEWIDSKFFSFSQTYLDYFDEICRRYGRYLQHQSDRELPRTLFNANYVTIAKKNAHEVAGILIVFLLIFSSTEGENKLDKSLGDGRSSSFIHIFELLLMLENFCKQHNHARRDLLISEKGIPLVMTTIKNTLNRQEGHGMKIIKFHLMVHFSRDILRFGSMRNFDSCIGERHHTTEVKDPARKTQRRKGVFEMQTAKRYVENIGIERACQELRKKFTDGNIETGNCVNKGRNIIYNFEQKKFFKTNWKTKKYEECIWKDNGFMLALKDTCNELIVSQKIASPVNFFTQHNREKTIFRADPSFLGQSPWYDWVNVDWGIGKPVPAKMLIFIDLTECFIEAFKVGTSYIAEPGFYAIAHTLGSAPYEKAHNISLLVEYGKVDVNEKNIPQLCFFNVNAIVSPCIAVPYKTTDTIMTAIKWLLLKPRNEWNNLFIEHLREYVKKKTD